MIAWRVDWSRCSARRGSIATRALAKSCFFRSFQAIALSRSRLIGLEGCAGFRIVKYSVEGAD